MEDRMAQLPRREEERRLAALGIREQAAEIAAERPRVADDNNGDEVNYPNYSFIGSYSKSLRHDSVGDPEPVSYGSLLRALETRDPADFEQIIPGITGAVKQTNPQGGLAFNLSGPDTGELTQPPAPRFDSQVTAHEAGELYWMAVARDIPFISWSGNAVITAAINSLNTEFNKFGGTVPVTVQNLFRGISQGDQVGPYVSQFLLKGNADPRKPLGQGRDSRDGLITYGSQIIDQKQLTVVQNVDYLTTFTPWLDVQNGWDRRGQDQFDATRRFIRTLRDGANYVHFDQVINAFYNAAWILLCEPTGNQLTSTARPCIDMEFPFNTGNPYRTATRQSGFATFGPPHVLEVIGEVFNRAIRAVWFQKWFVHRRLRPEEYGGRVDNHITGRRQYLVAGTTTPIIHSSILTSLQTGGLAPYFGGQAGDKFPSYLLPQAFPEGAPTHPSYGAGHATGSGACATILKAFFDDTKLIENPVVAAADGLSLVAYTGTGSTTMTVGGELNKLASNISLFRNAGGVHWRSDHQQSILLGETLAIRLLQELSITFNEDMAEFVFSKFDGTRIRIRDGFVDVVASAATYPVAGQPLEASVAEPSTDPTLGGTPPAQQQPAPAVEFGQLEPEPEPI
jgi:hypothetical protein